MKKLKKLNLSKEIVHNYGLQSVHSLILQFACRTCMKAWTKQYVECYYGISRWSWNRSMHGFMYKATYYQQQFTYCQKIHAWFCHRTQGPPLLVVHYSKLLNVRFDTKSTIYSYLHWYNFVIFPWRENGAFLRQKTVCFFGIFCRKNT